jgi:uncharacterized protein (DUF4415 family)
MSKKQGAIVKHKLDLTNPPALTAKQKAALEALAAMPDSAIDTSDIPPLPDQAWKQAEQGRFYKPVKQSTTVRIDADVLAWLRSQGRGYQTRINTILRREMLHALRK